MTTLERSPKGCGDDLVFLAAVETQFLDLRQHHLARLETVLAVIALRHMVLRRRDHPRLLVHQHDQRNVVAPGHFEIVEVMGAGDLHRTGAEFRIGIFIGDDGNEPLGNRQPHQLADQILVALIGGMHRHRAIAQHGLGPRGGNDDFGNAVDRTIGQRIGKGPHGALGLARFDLEIGNRRLEHRVPVHQPLVLVDQPFLVELHEDLEHRLGQALVHGEALARPVARRAQPPQLLRDDAARFGLPFPHALEEGLAAHGPAVGLVFLLQQPLHHHLRGDAGMVGARLPQHVAAAHALEADEDVLDGVVEGMPHVQRARDVGRRDDDGDRAWPWACGRA